MVHLLLQRTGEFSGNMNEMSENMNKIKDKIEEESDPTTKKATYAQTLK